MTPLLIELSPPQMLGEDERYTTRETLEWCRRKAGVSMFDVDVAACAESHHAPVWYGKEQNGLAQTWLGHVWANPPYSDLKPWVDRAWEAVDGDRPTDNCCSVSMLIPANRTDQRFWQNRIEPFRDLPDGRLRTHYLPGRTAFARPGSGGVGQSGAPFGCVLLCWKRSP